MQKKLLALAIAGALAAPMAVQAQGSNVQIYGLLQPSIDFVDNGDESGTSMAENNSRIGFKGSEDLGNGLKAIFQLESAVDLDDRTGAGWTRRDSWVGLSGSFGQVVAGTKFSAYKSSTDFIDPFGDTVGDYNNVFGVHQFDADGFNDRFTNGLHYTSPNFGGVTISATYGLNNDGDGDSFEDDSGDGDDDSFSVAVKYATGGLTLVAAYEDQKDRQNTVDLDDDGVTPIGFATTDSKAFKVAAGYKLGSTSFGLMYAKEDFGEISVLNDGIVGAVGDELKRDVIFASVKHSMGNIDLMASYTWADEFDDVDDTGANAFAVGAAYNFSKRTALGAYYALVDNDDNAGFGFDSGYGPSATGEKVKGFSVRLRHAF